MKTPGDWVRTSTLAIFALLLGAARLEAQLFENLKAFGPRLDLGDPAVTAAGPEGPKDVVAADLDGDGWQDLASSNLDGTVTVYHNLGGQSFGEPSHLRTGARTLRGLIATDADCDGRLDLATAAPYDSAMFVFRNLGNRSFAPPLTVPAWQGARNLAAGDFHGEGREAIVVAGPLHGLRQYRACDLGFQIVADIGGELDIPSFPKPVYSLRAFRPAGAARDSLLATHARSNLVWVLEARAPGGALEVVGRIELEPGVFAIDAAPIASPAASGVPDLITAHRDAGRVEVRRGFRDAAGRFGFLPEVYQRIPVPGGPRALSTSDLDQDGFKDLVVVLRNLDVVLTYRNAGGRLQPGYEMPVGQSPREVVVGSFDLDGAPDVAVINRYSSDLSVLLGARGKAGFSALDGLYLVDGEVTSLRVRDVNLDGRDDVLQLHRASGDLSVRLARPDGKLAPPRFYPMGRFPSDLGLADVNRDHKLDAITANLGRPGLDVGSISVRPGDGSGGFGPEELFALPPGIERGGLVALAIADFNNDTVLDLAAAFFDCRLLLYEGTGDGTFVAGEEETIIYENRSLAAGDFDDDGDTDLAGGAYTGDVVVLENRLGTDEGDLLTHPNASRKVYGAGEPGMFRAGDLIATDLDGDRDLDLVFGSGAGARVFRGMPGMGFEPLPQSLKGTESYQEASLASADLDGDPDGVPELVVGCRVLSCVTVLKYRAPPDRPAGGPREVSDYQPALVVDVPSAQFLAVGDLDGDGKMDLVGSGGVLWTALGGRTSSRGEPPVHEGERDTLRKVVINEVLAINERLPLEESYGRTSDWVELWNGEPAPRDLAGFRLSLEVPGEPRREFRFPAAPPLAAGGHLLVICDQAGQQDPPALLTGFDLPGRGGTLRLHGPGGELLDEVAYPEQFADVSHARYRDGLPSFIACPYPSPGLPNGESGPVEPAIALEAALPEGRPLDGGFAPPRRGQPIRFFARGRDDIGIVNASVLYRHLRDPGGEEHRIILYDDGFNQDGEMQDGLFSGVLPPLPPGEEGIRFFLEVEDLSGGRVAVPGDGLSGDDESDEDLYTLVVGPPPEAVQGLRISELVANNHRGLADETGQRPDWVEVRNCSGGPVRLDGVFLAPRYPATEDRFEFPRGKYRLAPGEHLVVFCDLDSGEGPLHAPFKLDAAGGLVVLAAETPAGGSALVDWVEYGPQGEDRAWARRQGCGDVWGVAEPSPGVANPAPQVLRGDVNASGRLDITDALVILSLLFLGGSAACPGAADVNGDAAADVSDAVHLLGFLFLGSSPPRPERLVGCE